MDYPGLGKTDENAEPAGDGRFTKTFTNVSEPFTFYFTGGDDSRDRRTRHKVEIVPPPELNQVEFSVKFPGYMERQTEKLDSTHMMLSAPVGGWIVVEGAANDQSSPPLPSSPPATRTRSPPSGSS